MKNLCSRFARSITIFPARNHPFRFISHSPIRLPNQAAPRGSAFPRPPSKSTPPPPTTSSFFSNSGISAHRTTPEFNSAIYSPIPSLPLPYNRHCSCLNLPSPQRRPRPCQTPPDFRRRPSEFFRLTLHSDDTTSHPPSLSILRFHSTSDPNHPPKLAYPSNGTSPSNLSPGSIHPTRPVQQFLTRLLEILPSILTCGIRPRGT